MNTPPTTEYPPHPRTIGWIGTSAMAMGGSNQSLFLITALFVGQGDILGQGSFAVPLLIVGLLLSWAAAPGWTELILMWPNRVGGIAATCGEAFRPYAPVLANLAGTCYWWGWVPTCGLTAILSASAIHEWYLPELPVPLLACALVAFFTAVNLAGIRHVTRLVIPIATASALLAFLSGLLPIFAGQVDWRQATTFHLTTPFDGLFGQLTAMMAGLYLIGFAAPAFEAAACHVGETVDPNRNVPRAMFASAAMAAVYFVLLPVVWLGTLGPEPLGKDLALVLGPTFAPLFGSAAKAAAIWFMMFNMFHGTVQPLAGAARTLAQLAEDGLLPRLFAWRSRTDAPWVATVLTAAMAILFLLIGDPVWLIAAANFTYLIGICLPSVAVWLLRRDAPDMHRPYRAPRGTIMLGVVAAGVWMLSAILGFQQFGLPTVLFGLVFAYSGAALYALRIVLDRRAQGLPVITGSLHIKLTGAMLAVLVLDGAGYLLAVGSVQNGHTSLIAVLEDIFVAVAILTISVGLILPGMIAHSAVEVSKAAQRLASGTVADFSRAMRALSAGDIDGAHARVDALPVPVHSRDELGQMAASFNLLQDEIAVAAGSMDGAREGLRNARLALSTSHAKLEERVRELDAALEQQRRTEERLDRARLAAEEANRAKSRFLANMSHEIRTPLNGVLGMSHLLLQSPLDPVQRAQVETVKESGESLLGLLNDLLDLSKIEAGKLELESLDIDLRQLTRQVVDIVRPQANKKGLIISLSIAPQVPSKIISDPLRLRQLLTNLLGNAVKFTEHGRVDLDVRSRAVDAQGLAHMLRFEVKDTGIGIEPETVPTLFAPFTQADASTTRRYGGTGLGLAISKQLVELMGGEIGVESSVGVGSRFWFTLPQREPTQVPVAAEAAPSGNKASISLKGRRVLLAEDNPVNRQVALAILKSLDIEAEAVENGKAALDALVHRNYDLVLMDCQMPQMDGYEATARIRAQETEQWSDQTHRRRIPIIALTANAMRGDQERCLAIGMDAYLAKPFTPEQLKAVLCDWLQPSPRAIPLNPGDAPSTGGGVRSSASSETAVDLEMLNSIKLLQDDDSDIVRDVALLFRKQAEQIWEQLELALRDGDKNGVRAAARALRIRSTNVGAARLAGLLIALEQAGLEDRISDAHPLYRAARDEVERVNQELARVSSPTN